MPLKIIPDPTDATAVPVASETNTISLDLSSRNKIVIHPQSSIKQKNIFLPSQVQSIFKNEKKHYSGSSSGVDSTLHSVAQRPVASSKIAASISRQNVPSPRVRDSECDARKIEKLARVREAMGRIEKKPIARPSPQAPRAVNPCSVTPVIPIPGAKFQSPYTEEYAKCGCTKRGGNSCRRCQLMLLSDRFCDLVNFQCEKWNAPV